MGIVVRVGGSTGGTDIIALIANKKTSLSVGVTVYMVDFVVLGIQASFSDMEQILSFSQNKPCYDKQYTVQAKDDD